MTDMGMNYFIISFAFALVLIPSFAIVTYSQSNNTLASDSLSNNSLSNASIADESNEDIPIFENETSFASLSRSLAEANQVEDEPIAPPPPSESESEGEAEEAEEDPNE